MAPHAPKEHPPPPPPTPTPTPTPSPGLAPTPDPNAALGRFNEPRRSPMAEVESCAARNCSGCARCAVSRRACRRGCGWTWERGGVGGVASGCARCVRSVRSDAELQQARARGCVWSAERLEPVVGRSVAVPASATRSTSAARIRLLRRGALGLQLVEPGGFAWRVKRRVAGMALALEQLSPPLPGAQRGSNGAASGRAAPCRAASASLEDFQGLTGSLRGSSRTGARGHPRAGQLRRCQGCGGAKAAAVPRRRLRSTCCARLSRTAAISERSTSNSRCTAAAERSNRCSTACSCVQ